MAALPNGIQSTQELLEAQCHIWNHIFSFINSMSLKCCVQLGIPDVIDKHNNPIKLSELADALSINQAKTACLGRLMRILVHSKFFTMAKIDDDEGYCLTPVSRLLCKDEPLSLASCVVSCLDPIMTDPGHRMGDWFKDDEPTPFSTTHGRKMWELMGENPRMNKLFNQCMSCTTELMMTVVAKDGRDVFEGLESLVDVGGGTGTLAKAIVDAFPGLKCTVLDLPHVVQGLEGSENLKFMEGDMFKVIPSAQAVSLKFIFHDWSDEECIQILEKCKEAIPSKEKGGKVIIIDMVVGDQKHNFEAMETQLFMDMNMMILLTGKERTIQEWEKLFFGAGFTSYKITPILGLRSIIEAVMKETLRLHPPIPFLVPRRAIEETNFMGYQIPKNTQLFVNAWAIGRDPECWDDPLSFKPDRFLDSKIDYRGQNFELLPFGAGRRICAGIPLAHRMLHMVLGSLLHEFDWSVDAIGKNSIMDTRERMGVTVRKLVPLKAIARTCST